MSLFEEIDAFCNRADTTIKQKARKDKIHLYAAGLKNKINQSEFALHNLRALSSQSEATTTSTDTTTLNNFDQVAFYCDSFCIFLYSSLDILAQIINQVLDMGMSEKEVNFLQIKTRLLNNHPTHQATPIVGRVVNSKAFKNLNRYRNCSVHRRQIYIRQMAVSISQTDGYVVSTKDISQVVRTICDNPYDIKPKIDQKRVLPDYLEHLDKQTVRYIISIITKLP